MYDIPILLIIFTRLDTTKKVFQKIREVKPKQLFIAADGPRLEKIGESEKCDIVRNWVLSAIDWECDVKTLFRDKNIGCGRGVSSSIDWFFDNVDYGIILEDDCVPSVSFFSYVKELLEKYKNEKKVWQICGHNTMGISKLRNNVSYSFVPIQACWGWATWKNRWDNFKYDISNEDKNLLKKNPYFNKKYRRDYWFSIFDKMTDDVKDVWDYQWTYRILKNKGYCAIPSCNLIENIGFGNDSTHFVDSNKDSSFHVFVHEMDNILHPKKIRYNWKLVKFTDKKVFNLPRKISFSEYLKIILKKLHLFEFVKSLVKK